MLTRLLNNASFPNDSLNLHNHNVLYLRTFGQSRFLWGSRAWRHKIANSWIWFFSSVKTSSWSIVRGFFIVTIWRWLNFTEICLCLFNLFMFPLCFLCFFLIFFGFYANNSLLSLLCLWPNKQLCFCDLTSRKSTNLKKWVAATWRLFLDWW